MEIINIIVILFLGWIGYLIFSLLSLPTPTLLGGLVIIMIIKIIGINLPGTHPDFLVVLQILLGLYFGLNINQDVCSRMSKMIVPIILMSLWSLGIMFFIGYLLYSFTDLDFLTSVLGAAPGGITEVGIIALSVGADVVTVSFLQILRLVVTLLFFPLIVRNKAVGKNKEDACVSHEAKDYELSEKRNFNIHKANVINITNTVFNDIKKLVSKNVIKTTVIAFCGGLLGNNLGIPVGAMLGALLFTAGFSLAGFKLEAPPTMVRDLTRIGIGALIGMQFTREFFYDFQYMLLPALLFTILILGTSVIMARIIEKITGWDRMTCVLATAPAGLSSMTALAMEVKCQPFEITMMHLARVLTIKTIVPILILGFI